MPCLLALLALEHLALDPAAPSPHTTVVQASVVIVLERASERWVQGHRSVGSGSVPRRLVLTNGVAAAVIITITDLFSQRHKKSPRRLMLTNGVAAAAIITMTDLSSQVGFMYLLTRSAHDD
uniref:CASP-like protein n=1 Tax=Oryza rufipogon TaxID=4529 RepID=A0A0E0QN90_ORYRU